jgi:hypothetical protein
VPGELLEAGDQRAENALQRTLDESNYIADAAGDAALAATKLGLLPRRPNSLNA